MSQSSVDDSLLKNPVSPFILPSWRKVRKPEKVRRELFQRAIRQSKCEYTGLRTTLSGVGVHSAWLEERRVGLTSDKKWMKLEKYLQYVSITSS